MDGRAAMSRMPVRVLPIGADPTRSANDTYTPYPY
ncbi:hypothetical protein KIPE111705_05380 [Kibdelosporangium persicum]